MNIDQLRKLCLSFPGTTEQIQWGDNLLFKVGGKMFAVAALEPAAVWMSLKANPENFAELTEKHGIIPAPYLARAKWIAWNHRTLCPPRKLPGCFASLTNWCWPSSPGICAKPSRGGGW